MPNQRRDDKHKVGFWATEAEIRLIKKEMDKLKIETYSEYLIYKCGLMRDEERYGPADGEKGVDKY